MSAFFEDKKPSDNTSSDTSDTSTGGTTSSGGGSTQSDVIDDTVVKAALANPAGMTQDFIKRILEQENIDPDLVKQVKERQASTLGEARDDMASREEAVRPDQKELKPQEVQVAPPPPERELSPVEVMEAVKKDVLNKAYAAGKTAHEGVEAAYKAGNAMLTMTNQELTGEKAMIGGKELSGDIASAVAGVRGLLSGMLDVNRGDSGLLAKQDSPAETMQLGQGAGRFNA